jgi:hypothetical protein
VASFSAKSVLDEPRRAAGSASASDSGGFVQPQAARLNRLGSGGFRLTCRGRASRAQWTSVGAL